MNILYMRTRRLERSCENVCVHASVICVGGWLKHFVSAVWLLQSSYVSLSCSPCVVLP